MKKLIFLKFTKDTVLFFLLMCFAIGVIVWTMQAVNYLDFVIQDGHGLKTYFAYSIFNFPKIINRIIPFIYFISLFYILTSYEVKNELIIFWTHGISKIDFTKKILIISIILSIIQMSIGGFLSPYFQYKARTYLKDSNMDFFAALIKDGKFINVVDGLTIFIDSKNRDGSFNNIFIDDSSKINSKMINAQKGILVNNKSQKIFKLFDGKVVNREDQKINIFEFEQIDFDLSVYSSSTILAPKIQEIPSVKLFNCAYKIFINKQNEFKNEMFNCQSSLYDEILQELFKRFFKPLYIPIIALLCCFLILYSKNNIKYYKNRRNILLITFLVIVVSEASLRYSTISIYNTITYLLLPFISFFIIYLIFNRKVRNV